VVFKSSKFDFDYCKIIFIQRQFNFLLSWQVTSSLIRSAFLAYKRPEIQMALFLPSPLLVFHLISAHTPALVSPRSRNQETQVSDALFDIISGASMKMRTVRMKEANL